jgi:hypothetical protein
LRITHWGSPLKTISSHALTPAAPFRSLRIVTPEKSRLSWDLDFGEFDSLALKFFNPNFQGPIAWPIFPLEG